MPKNPESFEPLLRVQDAAKILGRSVATVYRDVELGRIPHLKIQRHVRFRLSDLEAWIDEQRRDARVS